MADKWIREARQGKLGPSGADAAPAGTAALVRDGADGLEVLLARRSSKLAFHGGAWVFPGGRVDPADYASDPDDVAAAAARAAARETAEEAGMVVAASDLVYFSHWTTPDISPKRFATWFFLGAASDDEVVADGTETTALRWLRPADALAERDAREIELAPPQYVTLRTLDAYATVAEALRGVAAAKPIEVTPRFAFIDDGAICVYDDDVAYDDLDLDKAGLRHRLHMRDDNVWTYDRD